MKATKNLLTALFCITIPLLTANCSEKKGAENKVADKTESAIDVPEPPFVKFVSSKNDKGFLYKNPDKNSPTLVRWLENCEGDDCDQFYKWSDEEGKEDYIKEPQVTYSIFVYAVLGEEGDFYRVSTFSPYCSIESAYVPKADMNEVKPVPITAEMLESKDQEELYSVVKEGKYKGVVLYDFHDELWGESLSVGILRNGYTASPCSYKYEANLDKAQTEPLKTWKEDNTLRLSYNESLVITTEGEFYTWSQLDPKKLSDSQIEQIMETARKEKIGIVEYVYDFGDKGPSVFFLNAE